MIIRDVEFIKSATKPDEYTEPLFLEVAFAGPIKRWEIVAHQHVDQPKKPC